ncbi:MAG: hypothetical protein ACREH9_00755 [Pseudomonadota bacterium]
MTIAGCSGFGKPKLQPDVDPNIYPANYRSQIVTVLRTSLTDRADFHGALIAPPALESVPESQTQHYVVCLQLNGHNEQKNKVVIYFAGKPNEYIDATPPECANAAYQPFTELDAAAPSG